MRVQISYPVPMQTPENFLTFKPDIQSFVQSWRKYPPGIECNLCVVCLGSAPDDRVDGLFEGLPVIYFTGTGDGLDIGAAQQLADDFGLPGDFQISMPTRVTIQSGSWVRWMVDARLKHGPGLYGTSASRENNRFHFRTACYGMDVKLFRRYPRLITNEEERMNFESFIRDWVVLEEKLPAWVVYINSEHEDPNLILSEENVFRKGDQSNLLVWDRHCQIYADASPEEKRKLEKMTQGDYLNADGL